MTVFAGCVEAIFVFECDNLRDLTYSLIRPSASFISVLSSKIKFSGSRYAATFNTFNMEIYKIDIYFKCQKLSKDLPKEPESFRTRYV
jgi:hypothetical protein